MELNLELWMILLAGLPGLFSLIYNVTTGIINFKNRPVQEKKTQAETKKTQAEATQIQGEIYKGVIDELQEQVHFLRDDLDAEKEVRAQFEIELKREKSARIALERVILELKEKQDWYEKYIDALIMQLVENNIIPVERPEQIRLQ